MLDFLLDVLFPRKCVSCGKWGKFICETCRGKIEYFYDQMCPYCEKQSPYGFTHPRCQKNLGLDGMFVLAHYRGPIREALRKIKYQGTYGVVGEVVRLLGSKYHCQFDFDYFVPIPLHPNRERGRGFNQAEKIAENLAQMMDKRSGTKEVINILMRTRETKPQFGLKGKARQENVVNAFRISSHSSLVTGHSFCLVDDVATTGATIFECAKTLKRAGAKKVFAMTVARGG